MLALPSGGKFKKQKGKTEKGKRHLWGGESMIDHVLGLRKPAVADSTVVLHCLFYALFKEKHRSIWM